MSVHLVPVRVESIQLEPISLCVEALLQTLTYTQQKFSVLTWENPKFSWGLCCILCFYPPHFQISLYS